MKKCLTNLLQVIINDFVFQRAHMDLSVLFQVDFNNLGLKLLVIQRGFRPQPKYVLASWQILHLEEI